MSLVLPSKSVSFPSVSISFLVFLFPFLFSFDQCFLPWAVIFLLFVLLCDNYHRHPIPFSSSSPPPSWLHSKIMIMIKITTTVINSCLLTVLQEHKVLSISDHWWLLKSRQPGGGTDGHSEVGGGVWVVPSKHPLESFHCQSFWQCLMQANAQQLIKSVLLLHSQSQCSFQWKIPSLQK